MAMYQPQKPEEGPKRLSEPAGDTTEHLLSSKKNREHLENGIRDLSSGGYTGTGDKFAEPAEDTPVVDPQWQEDLNRGSRIELDAAAIQNLTQSLMNQKSYLQ